MIEELPTREELEKQAWHIVEVVSPIIKCESDRKACARYFAELDDSRLDLYVKSWRSIA